MIVPPSSAGLKDNEDAVTIDELRHGGEEEDEDLRVEEVRESRLADDAGQRPWSAVGATGR